MMAPVIVIGAGLAGWTTVREFRKLDTTTPVLLITADSGDFYAKPSLSNALAQGKLPAQLVSTPADKMAAAQNVTLLPHTRVSAIDTAAKTITTPAGAQAYRQLVLATGAQPIRIAVEGDAADQVLSVNSLQDFAAFHAHLQTATDQPDRHVLIMGAGLIGCEFANDLAQAGYRVSVVDPGARALAALLPEAASGALQQALEALGVRFYWGTTVRAVNAASGAGGLAVSLASGEELAAHGVLSAVGLRADTLLAQAAGLQVDRAIVSTRNCKRVRRMYLRWATTRSTPARLRRCRRTARRCLTSCPSWRRPGRWRPTWRVHRPRWPLR
jgi:rubredoxin-NAD+ reductase